VINPQFDDVDTYHADDYVGVFRGGLAPVQLGDAWGYIDKTGKYVWNPTE